ncbi:hypothetical protein [Thomasclavelia sp.]|uniref:hypothetical protein n=1 Tax=Thomasclavelia sp. TaxID=3025757 RepID=UPI0025D64FFD|nr:hypothetical protein [Thomasclavelia sp.]
MKDIYSRLMASQNASPKPAKKISREEYAKQKREQKNELYKMADRQLNKVISSPVQYLEFLKLTARLNYTVTNLLLVMAQKPDAVFLKDSDYWKEKKLYIRQDEKGIQILKPDGEYEKSNGSAGTNYRVKYVFDASQINTKKSFYKKPVMNVENLITGLTYESPVKLELTQMESIKDVYYSSQKERIYYADQLEPAVLIHGLLREFSAVEYEQQDQHSFDGHEKFCMDSAAYILCNKYGVPVDDVDFAKDVGEVFYDKKPYEIKKQLYTIQSIVKDVSDRIDKGIYISQQNRDNRDQMVR